MKKFKEYLAEKDLFKFMHQQNKGVFYRGVNKNGVGVGLGALGKGIYITWTESMANAYAKLHGISGVVKSFDVKKNLKMLDTKDPDWVLAKKALGLESWEWSDTLGYANAITREVKKMKYDGVVSDNPAEGILIFDKKNVKEIG